MNPYEQTIEAESLEYISSVFGNFDENIREVERLCGVSVLNRDTEIKISGEAENVSKAAQAINGFMAVARRGETLDKQQVNYILSLVMDGEPEKINELGGDIVCVTSKGRPVKGKTLGQKKYLEMIKKNLVTLAVGPAGTGKTYLAVAMAVAAFRDKEVNRIILTRPAVEAGEKLGFLPGDLQNKVDPYLRPLYDALFDMLGSENYQKYLERGNIEVAPLAFMRGRTLDDSFIILDEAQNTTSEQMKMFLTRIGFNSRVVVTGDITQVDLPDGKISGLREAVRVLAGVDGIGITSLTDKDIVRHELVGRIIRAYDKYQHKSFDKPKRYVAKKQYERKK